MPDFLPYALNLLVLGFLALIYHQADDQKRRIITMGCFVYFIFFFGFRGFIWHDWQGYYPMFMESSFDDLTLNPFQGGKDHFYEPGYILFNLLVGGIYRDYVFFQLMQTTLCCLLLFRFIIRRKLNVPFFLMLFLSFAGYEMLINLMRNSISILIFLNALEYIEKREKLPYFLLCTLALSFHLSSILFFPLYWVLDIKVNRWVFLGIFLVGAAFFALHVKLFSPILSMVTGSDESRIDIMMNQYGQMDEAKTFSVGFLERLMTGLLVFCYYGRLLAKDARNRICINAVLLYLSIVFFMNEMTIVSGRLGMLVIFGYWMIWYQLPQVMHFKNNKILFCCFIMLYSILKCNVYNQSKIYEYQNHLFGCRSYESSVQRMHKMEDEKR